MFEKIVQRVAVTADPETELVGLIDQIEFELLFVGNSTARNLLTEIVNEVRRSDGLLSEDGVASLLDVIERLKKIEQFLSDSGFTTQATTKKSASSAPESNDAGESNG